MKKTQGRGGKKIAEAMEELIKMMLSSKWPFLIGDGVRESWNGGVLTIRNRATGKIRSQWIIGNPPENRTYICTLFSQESGMQAFRMIRNGTPIICQSQNPIASQGVSSILTKDNILSFSGMTKLICETVLTVASVALKEISTRRADQIATASSNDAYWRTIAFLIR